MTTFNGREIRLLVVAASLINLLEIDVLGPDADEVKSVIYKAKSVIINDGHGILNCKPFTLRGDQ